MHEMMCADPCFSVSKRVDVCRTVLMCVDLCRPPSLKLLDSPPDSLLVEFIPGLLTIQQTT